MGSPNSDAKRGPRAGAGVTHLQRKTVLYETGDTIKAVYFPISSVVSLVVTLATGEMTEAAMVGNDGAVGMASALDAKVSLSHAVVQLGGDAMVCDPAAFKGAALQSESLISKVMRHEQTLFAQAQQSTACMAHHEVDARLCRWLLRARAAVGSSNANQTTLPTGNLAEYPFKKVP